MSEFMTVAAKAKDELRVLETDAASIVKRVQAAIDRWYEAHFHRAVATNTQPLPASDKAALHAAVADALQPAKE